MDESKQPLGDKKATVVFQDKTIAKQIQSSREQIKLIEARKRSVFEAICCLSDPVSEETLLKYLPLLDVFSWQEIVEERYLGRLCGYPLCANEIVVNFRAEFKVLQNNESVKSKSGEHGSSKKFCSDICRRLSNALLVQLERRNNQQPPQHQPNTTNASASKIFIIPNAMSLPPCDDDDHAIGKDASAAAEAQIVFSLFDLKVTDYEEAEAEEETDEECWTGEDNKGDYARSDTEDEKKFLNQLKSYLSAREMCTKKASAGGASAVVPSSFSQQSSNLNPATEAHSVQLKDVDDTLNDDRLRDVLAKLRRKYDVRPQTMLEERARRESLAPKIIAPRSINIHPSSTRSSTTTIKVEEDEDEGTSEGQMEMQ